MSLGTIRNPWRWYAGIARLLESTVTCWSPKSRRPLGDGRDEPGADAAVAFLRYDIDALQVAEASLEGVRRRDPFGDGKPGHPDVHAGSGRDETFVLGGVKSSGREALGVLRFGPRRLLPVLH